MCEIIDLEFKIKKFGAKVHEEPDSDIDNANEESKEEQIDIEVDDEKKMKHTISFELPEKYHNEEVNGKIYFKTLFLIDHIEVSIMGNFTMWIPESMNKDDTFPHTYAYTALLERGYKHRYQFMVNGDELVDENKKTSVNPTGSRTNYIMIPLKTLESLHKGDISQFM